MKKDEEAFRRLLQFAGPDTTPRPGFQQALLERILERARALENNPSFTLRPRRPIWIARIVSMAAAVLLVSMACWWLLGGRVGVASADFSEMLRRIRQATTAAYEQVLRLPGQPEVKVQVQIAYPGRIRTTWPEGKVQIFDLAKHTCMGLSPATRKATQVRIPVSAGYEDPLENLRRTDVSAGRLEGRGKCDGRDAVVYRIDQAEGVMRVWVAPEDELPLRIEFKVRGEDGQEAVTVLEHFRWNQPIPDSEFSLAVPPGYTLAIPESNPTEQSLIDLLRTCADLNGGVFPAKLTSLVVHDLVLKSPRGSAYLSDSRAAVAITHTDDGDDEVKEAYRSCLRGPGVRRAGRRERILALLRRRRQVRRFDRPGLLVESAGVILVPGGLWRPGGEGRSSRPVATAHNGADVRPEGITIFEKKPHRRQTLAKQRPPTHSAMGAKARLLWPAPVWPTYLYSGPNKPTIFLTHRPLATPALA